MPKLGARKQSTLFKRGLFCLVAISTWHSTHRNINSSRDRLEYQPNANAYAALTTVLLHKTDAGTRSCSPTLPSSKYVAESEGGCEQKPNSANSNSAYATASGMHPGTIGQKPCIQERHSRCKRPLEPFDSFKRKVPEVLDRT